MNDGGNVDIIEIVKIENQVSMISLVIKKRELT